MSIQDDIKRLRVLSEERFLPDASILIDRICDALEASLKTETSLRAMLESSKHLAELQRDMRQEAEDALENLDKTHTALIHKYSEVKEQLEVSLKDNDALSQSFYDCNKYAVELEAKLAARPNITNERLRQIRVKLMRRWKEIKDLEDQVDVQGAANARLEMRATALADSVAAWKARAEKKGEQAEAGHLKLEKCIAELKIISTGHERSDKDETAASSNYHRLRSARLAADALLKELGIE